MRRRTRHWSLRVAMLLGIALGLWLLAQMRPGEVPSAPLPPPATTPDAVAQPVRMPKPARVLAEPADQEAAAEPDRDVELVDTGDSLALAEVVLVLEDVEGYAVDMGWPYVTDCEIASYGRTEDGGFSVLVPVGQTCLAWGVRRDGLLTVRSEEVAFEAVDGTEIALQFPVERTGGIGVRFKPAEDGMLVLDVLPGTPAWEAGLTPGDRIVSVDGIDAAALDAEDFVDSMTGPEGTDVEFEVAFDGDTGMSIANVALTRAYLSG